MADTYQYEWGVGGRTKTVKVTRTIEAADNYTANDVLSDNDTDGSGTALNFPHIAKQLGGAGYITKARVQCSATSMTCRLRLYLYKNTPTSELDDNAANTAPSTADRANYIGYIDFPALAGTGGNVEAEATPSYFTRLPLAYNCDADDDDLYGILITRDAETNEAASMTMVISLTSEWY